MNITELNPIFLMIVALLICLCFYFLMEKVRRMRSLGANFDIRKEIKKTKELPSANTTAKEEVLIGTDRNGKRVTIPADTSHVYVCGTTGTGKTVALSNFIKTAVTHDYPLLIIDGKGDTGEGSILEMVNSLKGEKKLYIVDMNSPETCAHYNPFRNTSPTVIKDMLINLTTWSEEHYKNNAERYLQCLISLMMKLEIPLSLPNIVKYSPVDDFLVQSKLANGNGAISKEEHLQNMNIAKSSGKIAQDAMARFSTIIEGELGSIFADNGIDIITALKEKAIILFILNPLLYPELSPKIANLVIIDSKKAVSHLFKEPQGRTFFMFDEVNVYCSTSLLDLVNKSRSASVTCILASQTLSDLDALSENFRNQLIENCNNYLVLRQNTPDNAEAWANLIGTRQSMDVTYQVKMDGQITSDTGMGSARKTRVFYFHPDHIKQLKKGEALYIDKNNNKRYKVKVNKPD